MGYMCFRISYCRLEARSCLDCINLTNVFKGVCCPTVKFQNSVSTSAVGHCERYQKKNLPVPEPSPLAAKNSAHLLKLAFGLVRNESIIPLTEMHECPAVELGQ